VAAASRLPAKFEGGSHRAEGDSSGDKLDVRRKNCGPALISIGLALVGKDSPTVHDLKQTTGGKGKRNSNFVMGKIS